MNEYEWSVCPICLNGYCLIKSSCHHSFGDVILYNRKQSLEFNIDSYNYNTDLITVRITYD